MTYKQVFLITIISFFVLFQPLCANAGTYSKVKGKTIKGVVRIAVFVVNLQNLKKRILLKIEKSDKKRFDQKYKSIYKAAKKLPEEIKELYAIKPAMSKERMIKNVENIDKKQIYDIIRKAPDEAVAELFHIYKTEIKATGNEHK